MARAGAATERRRPRRGNAESCDQERFAERRREPHALAPRGEQRGEDQHAGHDAQRAGEKREAARRALLGAGERAHDLGHVRDLKDAEPDAGREQRTAEDR
jgi:hypothetical protein